MIGVRVASPVTKKSTHIITPQKKLGVMGYFCLIIFAVVALVSLQRQYWHGENGRANLNSLEAQIAKQNDINAEQAHTNSLLRADVRDLKTQSSAIEEHARLDLGLIKPGETFYQMSNAPITYSRQMATSGEADAVEPVEGLIKENGEISQ